MQVFYIFFYKDKTSSFKETSPWRRLLWVYLLAFRNKFFVRYYWGKQMHGFLKQTYLYGVGMVYASFSFFLMVSLDKVSVGRFFPGSTSFPSPGTFLSKGVRWWGWKFSQGVEGSALENIFLCLGSTRPSSNIFSNCNTQWSLGREMGSQGENSDFRVMGEVQPTEETKHWHLTCTQSFSSFPCNLKIWELGKGSTGMEMLFNVAISVNKAACLLTKGLWTVNQSGKQNNSGYY